MYSVFSITDGNLFLLFYHFLGFFLGTSNPTCQYPRSFLILSCFATRDLDIILIHNGSAWCVYRTDHLILKRGDKQESICKLLSTWM